MAYISPLRVPSEALTATRAFPNDPIAQFIPQEEKALVWARTHKSIDVVITKFAFRKNLRNGRILKRPCICKETNSLSRLLRHPRTFRPLVKRMVSVGKTLFPGSTSNKFIFTLKALMSELGFDRPQEYSSKAFRRCATREILETGAALGVIISSGTCAAAGYRAYLDLQMGEALNISSLLIESIGSDSGETDDEPPATIGRLRNGGDTSQKKYTESKSPYGKRAGMPGRPWARLPWVFLTSIRTIELISFAKFPKKITTVIH